MTWRLLRNVIAPGALLVVVAIVLVARPDSDQVATSPLAPATAVRRAQPSAQDPTEVDVKLELLNRAAEREVLSNRNPFRFVQKPAPVVAIRRAPPPPPQNVPVFEGPPPPPPIPLRFIGIIEASERTSGRVGIFSDGRGAVIHGREGEVIDGRYRVLRLGSDSVELAYADGRGRQTIRLSGQ